MFPYLWLGIVLSSGPTAFPTAGSEFPLAEVRPALLPENKLVDGHWRNPDFDQIPKTPPVGAKIAYSSINTSQPVVAMTFDDGPHKTNTPRLLDILKERNIKATFFVVGKNAKAYPDIIRRILAEGHEIGNHTWDHKQLTAMSMDRVRQELISTDEAVTAASGYHMQLMRPPYGATNLHVRQVCLDEFKYHTILWSVDPVDWKRPGSAVVEQRIVTAAHNGAIILSHDIHEPTIDAMPGTLDTLLSKGFRFVTVSQLMSMDEPPKARPVAEAKPAKNHKGHAATATSDAATSTDPTTGATTATTAAGLPTTAALDTTATTPPRKSGKSRHLKNPRS